MTEFLRKQQENIIYLLIFALLFAAPILSLYVRSVNDDIPFHWDEVIDVWKILTVYVIIFAIHNFLLCNVPPGPTSNTRWLRRYTVPYRPSFGVTTSSRANQASIVRIIVRTVTDHP